MAVYAHIGSPPAGSVEGLVRAHRHGDDDTAGSVWLAHYMFGPTTTTVQGTAAAALGALSATAAGTRTVQGSAAASLGGLSASATGTRTVHGSAAAPCFS